MLCSNICFHRHRCCCYRCHFCCHCCRCFLLIVDCVCPFIAVDTGVFIPTAAERGGRTAVAATAAAMPAGVALSTPCLLLLPPPRYPQAAAAATAAALPTMVLLLMTPRCPLPVSSSQPQRRAVAAQRWRRLIRSWHNNAALLPLPRCRRHRHCCAITTTLLPCCPPPGLLPALGDGGHCKLLCVS